MTSLPSGPFRPSSRMRRPIAFLGAAVAAVAMAALAAPMAFANTVPICAPPDGFVASGQPVLVSDGCFDPDLPTSLTHELLTGPSNGTLSASAIPGFYTYTSFVGFSGDDSFTVRAFDGADYSNTATATIHVADITVNQPPECPNSDAFVASGGSIDLHGNCTDADHDPITYALVSGTHGGSLQPLGPSSIRYTPNPGTTSDSFVYSARDPFHPPVQVTVHITVTSPGAGTFDTAADATPSQPYVASVTTTQPGPVAIDSRGVTAIPPAGYFLLNQEFDITAPPAASASNPLSLTFTIDASKVPAEALTVFRNGAAVADPCTGAVGVADPDPCVESSTLQGDGDLRITVLSTHASIWNFGVAKDTTPPSITLTTPAEGASFLLGAAVQADYSCADEAGGRGLASCNGDLPNGAAIDTASVGSKTFTVNAADHAGNRASVTHNYNVVYDFHGFFSPVDNQPALNSAKAGQAVPVKFSLGGNQGAGVLASGYPKSQAIACGSSDALDGTESTAVAGVSSLSYDPGADQYAYVWKTDKAWAGTCRQLVVKLNDGSSHRANFSFK